MGIQGFNLYWLNNCYKNISPPTFGADSHSTTKPSCSSNERNTNCSINSYGMGSLTKLR